MNSDKTLFWAITGFCSLRCKYCFYETNQTKRINERVSLLQAKLLVNKFKEFINHVIFTGGEPLSNPDFWKIASLVKDSGMAISIVTDGFKIHEILKNNRLSFNFSKISISLDCTNPEKNDRLRVPRGHNMNTSLIINNIKSLAKQRPLSTSVVILQTISRQNIDDIEDMINFCDDHNIDHLVHPANIPRSNEELSRISLDSASSDELNRLESFMYKWAKNHQGRIKYTKIVMEMLHSKKITDFHCPMGTSYSFLNVDGILSPCFHRMDLAYGNLYKMNVTDLFSKSVPNDITKGVCANLGCACMLE